jgi:ubiquinone/menaquinone biosynthesis C-methylase UbiE
MMLHVANLRPGNRVLDVAAGTGDQTLMAARRVGPTGYVLATDISANMLKLASDAAREADLTNVETRVMDAENLDLDANSFDSAICRQGLMLFSNPVKALVEMRRVVKPAGKVGALVKLAPLYGQVRRKTHTRRFLRNRSPHRKTPGSDLGTTWFVHAGGTVSS